MDVIFLYGSCKKDIESDGREPHPSPIRISQNLRGFVHLEAISSGGLGIR